MTDLVQLGGTGGDMDDCEFCQLHRDLGATWCFVCMKLLDVPSNNGVQSTAELAGREDVAAEFNTERQPAAADA